MCSKVARKHEDNVIAIFKVKDIVVCIDNN